MRGTPKVAGFSKIKMEKRRTGKEKNGKREEREKKRAGNEKSGKIHKKSKKGMDEIKFKNKSICKYSFKFSKIYFISF